jgi:hypothetical protein
LETYIRTPQAVFIQPQQLVVPLFQRPYVWNLEVQWQPLWDDIERQARRLLEEQPTSVSPHFLGAVVLQQSPTGVGGLQEWTIIDGQQRLTTLQIACDAIHAVIEAAGVTSAAAQLRDVIENGEAYRRRTRDRFKVWPTNRDQPGFEEVMTAPTPVDYSSLEHPGARLVEAHHFFGDSARAYLGDRHDLVRRADALAIALLHSLQLVVIALNPDENAQEIFETLNARGTPLTAADLIKNLVFQRLAAEGEDTERAYEEQWRQFETGFWEEQVSQGRIRQPRISLFFNHWLIATIGEEVVAGEVFRMFKRYVGLSEQSLGKLLHDIVVQAGNYRELIEAGEAEGELNRLSLFLYRTHAMDMEVVKPLVMWLTDPVEGPCPSEQTAKAVACIESWLVRRMLVGATTKAYNRVLLELLARLQSTPRDLAGDEVERFLREQNTFASYWPGDEEVRETLTAIPIYRKLPRARTRLLLEAIEDHLRGFNSPGAARAGEQQVTRGRFTIEHVMPQEWAANWPLGDDTEEERNRLVQNLGNLTLLTHKFNSSVSNARWDEADGKRAALERHSVLLLNRHVVAHGKWNEELIRARAQQLIDAVLAIWPVPEGHVGSATDRIRSSSRAKLSDLVNAGMLEVGQRLKGRGAGAERYAIILQDGKLEVDGSIYGTPSGAGRAVLGRSVNGWWFWLVDPATGTNLFDLAAEYRAPEGELGQEDEDED